jgi:hypothetical protein
MAHDWARRYAARNRLEPGMPERRSCASENVGSAFRSQRINGIRFKRWCIGALCRFHCCFDQSRHDTLPAIAAPHVKARDRPDRHIVQALERSRAIEPRQIIPWRKLTPADGPPPSNASKPGGGPCFTISWNARLFFWRSRLWYSLPILQNMHQQPLLAPPLPNKSSRAGQRSGVSGRIVSGMLSTFSWPGSSTCDAASPPRYVN